MLLELFTAFCLYSIPVVKQKSQHRIQQVVKVEQPDLIKWNLQNFYDAMQRDDRYDMNKFAVRSIELLKQNKEYSTYLRVHKKNEYSRLMNLKRVIPLPFEVKVPIEMGAVCKTVPSQKPYQYARRYTIPGKQIPRSSDNLPGNRK